MNKDKNVDIPEFTPLSSYQVLEIEIIGKLENLIQQEKFDVEQFGMLVSALNVASNARQRIQERFSR